MRKLKPCQARWLSQGPRATKLQSLNSGLQVSILNFCISWPITFGLQLWRIIGSRPFIRPEATNHIAGAQTSGSTLFCSSSWGWAHGWTLFLPKNIRQSTPWSLAAAHGRYPRTRKCFLKLSWRLFDYGDGSKRKGGKWKQERQQRRHYKQLREPWCLIPLT